MTNKKPEQLMEEIQELLENLTEAYDLFDNDFIDGLLRWHEKALSQKEEDVRREIAVELQDMAHDIIDHRNNALSAQEKDWHEGQLHLVKKLIDKLTKTK